MNWAQFKDPHCYLCLHGAVKACWFITQEVVSSNTPFYKNNFYRFCRFFRINSGKTWLSLSLKQQNTVTYVTYRLLLTKIFTNNVVLYHWKLVTSKTCEWCKSERQHIGVFPKWEKFSLNSAKSGNQINHWSMNWAEFKDPVPHMSCTGAVVACWSLTQEVAGVRILLLQWQFFFVTEFSEFTENI